MEEFIVECNKSGSTTAGNAGKLTAVINSAARVSSEVNVMDFSHVEFNIIDVVEDCVAWARMAHQYKEIDFDVQFDSELPHKLRGVWLGVKVVY